MHKSRKESEQQCKLLKMGMPILQLIFLTFNVELQVFEKICILNAMLLFEIAPKIKDLNLSFY